MMHYKECLQKKGVAPSIQRLRILRYLDEHRSHPTVDEVYTALIDEIPTLSKTTVYNTLSLFVSKKLVSEVNIGDKELHYDIVSQLHGHMRCISCGTIFDVDVSEDMIEDLTQKVKYIEDIEINIRGYCPECMKQQENKRD